MPVKVVVHDHHGMPIITERTPPDIIVPPAPVDPSWSPDSRGYPVPTETPSPVPPSIMGDTPSPWIIRHPRPPHGRIPAPSSVIIRPPLMMDHIRNPDIPVSPLVNPTAIVGQFILVLVQLRGKIVATHRAGMEVISIFIPLRKTVIRTAIEVNWIRREIPVGNKQLLFTLHKKGTFFSRGLNRTFINQKFCLPVFSDVKPVEPCLHYVKRCIRSMDFKAHIFVQVTHPQKYTSGHQMEFGCIISAFGEFDEIELSVTVYTEIVFSAKMYFCPAFPCPHLVSFDDR